MPRRLRLAALGQHFGSMHRIARALGWLILASLAFVTLAPIGLRPVSGAPVGLERFGAFAVLGALLTLGYPKHPVRIVSLVVLVALWRRAGARP